jgi:serine/threonine protein kinase
MLRPHYLSACLLAITTLLSTLNATVPENVRGRIYSELKAKKYDELGTLLNAKIGQKEISLSEVRKIALLAKSTPLLQALDATEDFSKQSNRLGLSVNDFLQIALFIETELQAYTLQGQYYLPKSQTGLSRTIEYDPQTHNTFIVVDGTKSAYLGEGARKKVYKSIFYNNAHPKIVARAEQRGGMTNEVNITKRLRGSPGIFSMEGFGTHKKDGKNYTTIYSELYNAGDLKTIFANNVQFSLYEKMQIALTILQGLESMKNQQIVHRDLGSKNIFLSIAEGEPGKRKMHAAIADFGCAKYISNMSQTRAQVSMRNTAPEGVYFNKLKGSDFFATDVYAAGLVLYHLFYGERASWQDKNLDSSNPRHFLYEYLIRKVNQKIQPRRRELTSKKVANQISAQEEFELLILQMLHTTPKWRPSASKLRQTMQSIFSQYVAHDL